MTLAEAVDLEESFFDDTYTTSNLTYVGTYTLTYLRVREKVLVDSLKSSFLGNSSFL